MNGYIGFGLVLLSSGLLLILSFLRRKSPAVFRQIPAFNRLKRAVGLSVEEGTRLHVSVGHGGLQTPGGAPALATFAVLRYLVEQTSVSDKPPIVTSGEGVLSILSRDTLKAGYRTAAAEEIYNPTTGRLTGLSPFSYAAGALPMMRDESVSANIIIGHFGPEVALLADTMERTGSQAVAAADQLAAQALLYASVDDPLIGEELFAASAYVGANHIHQAGLQTQDALRWLFILVLLGGAVLKFVGLF